MLEEPSTGYFGFGAARARIPMPYAPGFHIAEAGGLSDLPNETHRGARVVKTQRK